jgi:hypothetical protein
MKKDGTPLINEKAADMLKGRLAQKGIICEVIEHEGGWACKEISRERIKKRVPIGYRNLLTVEGKEEDFEYRWVNDEDGRPERFEEVGYERVTHDVRVGDSVAGRASQLGSVVSRPVGGGKQAVLMRIPKEWYDEDQKAKQKRVEQSENAMKRNIPKNQPTADGDYGDANFDG